MKFFFVDIIEGFCLYEFNYNSNFYDVRGGCVCCFIYDCII